MMREQPTAHVQLAPDHHDRPRGWAAYRYVVLILAGAGITWLTYSGRGGDWDYLRQGSDLLFGQRTVLRVDGGAALPPTWSTLPGGLHLYANYPSFQIGPLTLALVALIRTVSGPYGRLVTACLGTALAIPTIWLVESAATRLRSTSRRPAPGAGWVVVGGVAVLVVWAQTTVVYAHLDDALVLLASAVAVWAVTRRRPWLLGVALAVAVAAKPTGIVALPLLLALPGRAALRAACAALAGIALAWLPFVLADPGTLVAAQPAIEVAQATALHVVGLHAHVSWIRPVQALVALLAGTVAVRRGRWMAVILVGAAGRLLLEPGAASYYAAGLVLGALVLEALVVRQPRGLLTAAALVVFSLVPYQLNLPLGIVATEHVDGWLRLVATSAVILAVVLTPRHFWERAGRSADREPTAAVREVGQELPV